MQTKNMKTIRVVAAVIRQNGKVFATQRGYGEWKDGWDPFPLVKDIVGYLKMCHSILPIKR